MGEILKQAGRVVTILVLAIAVACVNPAEKPSKGSQNDDTSEAKETPAAGSKGKATSQNHAKTSGTQAHIAGGASRTVAKGTDIVKNGSFEDWDDSAGLPVSWELKTGAVTKSEKATDGKYALQLEVDKELGSRVQLSMRNKEGFKGRKLVVLMDANCPPSAAPGDFIFDVQVRIGGEWKGISKNPKTPGNPWVPYSNPGGGWKLLRHEMDLTSDMDLTDIRIQIYLLKRSPEPALVDNVAVYIVE